VFCPGFIDHSASDWGGDQKEAQNQRWEPSATNEENPTGRMSVHLLLTKSLRINASSNGNTITAFI